MATPRTIRFEQWQLDAKTEEEYHAALKAHRAATYEDITWAVGRDNMMEMEDPAWVLKDMIQQNGLTILHGDPGSGKSLIAMDWAYTLGHESLKDWLGKERNRQYRPMYLFTEGVGGLKRRTLAWEIEKGVGYSPDIVYVMTPVGMNPKEGTSKQLSSLERLYVNENCDLLIIDTLANTMLGNENQQEDANNYLRTIRHFQQWGPVILVHHNTKAGDDYRGSSVFKGAADTMVGVSMSEHGIIDLKITKQKDGDPSQGRMTLALRQHEWEVDGGYTRNSVALEAIDKSTARPNTMTAKQRELYEWVINRGTVLEAGYVAEGRQTNLSNLKRMIEKMDTLRYISGEGNSPALIEVVQEEEPTTL